MRKIIVGAFLFGLVSFGLIFVKGAKAEGRLKFDSTLVCHNGQVVKKPFYYGTLFTANWRVRYRVRNVGNMPVSGNVCYSDSFSIGRDYCSNGRRGFGTIMPGKYVDVNHTFSGTFCGDMALMLNQYGTGDGDPYYFVDSRYPSFLNPCAR